MPLPALKFRLGHGQSLWHLVRYLMEALSYSVPPSLTSSIRIKDLLVQKKKKMPRLKPVAKIQKKKQTKKNISSIKEGSEEKRKVIYRCYRSMVHNYCENRDYF